MISNRTAPIARFAVIAALLGAGLFSTSRANAEACYAQHITCTTAKKPQPAKAAVPLPPRRPRDV